MNNDLQKALNDLADAAVNFVTVFWDSLKQVINSIDFSGLSDLSKRLTCYKQAYDLAAESNPKWVWIAEHHKKWRIRKKYHDKIMRTYGGVNERY